MPNDSDLPSRSGPPPHGPKIALSGAGDGEIGLALEDVVKGGRAGAELTLFAGAELFGGDACGGGG